MKINKLALLIAMAISIFAISYYVADNQKVKFDFTVEVLEGKGPGQLFCSNGGVYKSEYSQPFKYDVAQVETTNVYRFYGIIPCGEKAQRIRYDPLISEGLVRIKSMRVRSFMWHQVDMNVEFERSVKPMNAISSLELIDGEIEIRSAGFDPHIQLLKNLDHYRKIQIFEWVIAFICLSGIGYLFLMLIQKVWVFTVTNLHVIESFRLRSGRKINDFLDDFCLSILSFFWSSISVNYLLAGFSFLILSLANFLFIEAIYKEISTSSLMAYISSEARALIAIALVSTILQVIRGHRALRVVVVWIFTILSITYLADALLYRINGMHVGHGIGMLFDGGVGNFSRNLEFTKLSNAELITYQLVLLVIFVVCFMASSYSVKFTDRKNLEVKPLWLLASVGVFLGVVWGEQIESVKIKTGKHFSLEQSEMPFYLLFSQAKNYLYSYDVEVGSLADINGFVINESLESKNPNNIYLFILESVREDVIGPKVTPNINAFLNDAIVYERGVANGNATHYGWYSIVNSRFPLYWEYYRNLSNVKGSSALNIFKQSGFSVNIHTAKNLHYLGAQRTMFGDETVVYDFISKYVDKSAPDRDRLVTAKLIDQAVMRDKAKSSINVIFYDSTHYPYHWPESMEGSLSPFAGKPLSSVSLNTARDLSINDRPMIFNRYLNSINYTDSLFGEFVNSLKENELYESATIVVVGDHGQQFMEHDFLMHGKTLFNEDINIPLYFKVPGIVPEFKKGLVSQVDIMPTLLDVVGLGRLSDRASDGKSILNPGVAHKFDFSAAAGIQNTPYNMILETDDKKLLFELESKFPMSSKKLYVKGILDKEDQEFVPGSGSESDYREYIKNSFEPYLKKAYFLDNFNNVQ